MAGRSNAPHETVKLTPVMPDVSNMAGQKSGENGSRPPSPALKALPWVVLVAALAGLAFMLWKIQTPPDQWVREKEQFQAAILQHVYEQWLQMGGTHVMEADADLPVLTHNLLQKLASSRSDTAGIGEGKSAVYPDATDQTFSSANVRLNISPAALVPAAEGVILDEKYLITTLWSDAGTLEWDARAIAPLPILEQEGLPLYGRRQP